MKPKVVALPPREKVKPKTSLLVLNAKGTEEARPTAGNVNPDKTLNVTVGVVDLRCGGFVGPFSIEGLTLGE